MTYSFTVPILAIVSPQLLFIHTFLSLNKINALNLTNAYLHHECIKSEGTYKSGSQFEKNVNQAIKALSEADILYGNYGVATGDGPDYVKSRVQCRGDLSISQCNSCLATAISEIRKRCPNNKRRIIWYDYCVFEITSFYEWDKIDHQSNFFMYNAKDVSGDKEFFNKKTRALLLKLKEKATDKRNSKYGKNYMYATEDENLGTKKLYAMVQCMKNLRRKKCIACLNFILEKIPKCCDGKQGGRYLCISCNFRYELYPFVKPLVNDSSV